MAVTDYEAVTVTVWLWLCDCETVTVWLQAYIFLMKIVDVVALVLALIGQCSRIWYFAKTDVVAQQSLMWSHVC